MRKFKCPKCGCIYTGKKDICPSCGTPMHYRDETIKEPENYNALPSFHYDAPDVMKDGIQSDDEVEEIEVKTSNEKNKPIISPAVNFPENGESYFDGWLIQRIGWRLLGLLITLCTGFICFPWAMCYYYRWETKHTVIKGRRLRFDGKGGQLFGRYILWLFLTVITCGIFVFWLTNKVKKWKAKHTVFAPFDERDLTENKDEE